MKTKVLSAHCVRVDFIEYQYRSLAKFFLDEYEFIIINDGKTPELREGINSECDRLDIKCYETPNDLLHSSAPVACASVLQWTWDDVIMKEYSDCRVALLDSDMFMIREFSMEKFLGDAVMAGIPQRRGKIAYFWNGIMFFDVPNMPNPERMMLYCGVIRGQNVDVGGMTYYYLMENPRVGIRAIPHTSHVHSDNQNLYVLPSDVLKRYNENYRIEICAESFLHYGSGTNWKAAEAIPDPFQIAVLGDSTPPKTQFVFWLLDSCIDGRIKMPPISYVFQEGLQ